MRSLSPSMNSSGAPTGRSRFCRKKARLPASAVTRPCWWPSASWRISSRAPRSTIEPWVSTTWPENTLVRVGSSWRKASASIFIGWVRSAFSAWTRPEEPARAASRKRERRPGVMGTIVAWGWYCTCYPMAPMGAWTKKCLSRLGARVHHKDPPQKPTVAGFFSGLVGGWGTGGSGHGDKVVDRGRRGWRAAARHLAVGVELAGNAHCGNAFDAVNVLQLRCAARLVGDVEGVIELLELGGVQALLVRPGQDILVLVQLLLFLMDGAKHLGMHLAELAHAFERIEQLLLGHEAAVERYRHAAQVHVFGGGFGQGGSGWLGRGGGGGSYTRRTRSPRPCRQAHRASRACPAAESPGPPRTGAPRAAPPSTTFPPPTQPDTTN